MSCVRHILIVGATSAIAEATAHRFARDGARFLLAARNAEKLEAVAANLRIRSGCEVSTTPFDALEPASPVHLVKFAQTQLGRIDLALIAYGSLPDQKACEQSIELARREIQINALSVIDLLTRLANQFEAQGHGTLAVISSVAGDRGRQSNYIYCTAKGMISIFLEGLRNRLDRKGVHVLTIKPGFVNTPMTAAFEKSGMLWARPEDIAEGIYQAVMKRRDVVYLPWFWRIIMLILRHIPERMFKRMEL